MQETGLMKWKIDYYLDDYVIRETITDDFRMHSTSRNNIQWVHTRQYENVVLQINSRDKYSLLFII